MILTRDIRKNNKKNILRSKEFHFGYLSSLVINKNKLPPPKFCHPTFKKFCHFILNIFVTPSLRNFCQPTPKNICHPTPKKKFATLLPKIVLPPHLKFFYHPIQESVLPPYPQNFLATLSSNIFCHIVPHPNFFHPSQDASPSPKKFCHPHHLQVFWVFQD